MVRQVVGKEHEVKFSADSATLSRIAEQLSRAGTVMETGQLRTTYFDTAALDLWRKHILLRIRADESAGGILCVKTEDAGSPGNAFLRTETEVATSLQAPDIGLFPKPQASALAKVIGSSPLRPQFSTDVQRTTASIAENALRVEIAIDRGSLVAPGRTIELHEVEIELKQGEPAGFLSYARRFCTTHALTLDFASKAAKGFAGHKLAPRVTSAAPRIDLGEAATVGEAACAIMAACGTHFTANWSALTAGDAPEAVHQMRVALRRMRSAIWMFRHALQDARWEELESAARLVGTSLATARKFDVFLEGFDKLRSNSAMPPEAMEEFRRKIASLRQKAYSDARRLVLNSSTSDFVLAVHQFVATGFPGNVAAAAPVADFAEATLARLAGKARKRGRRLGLRTPEELHKLRISLKKLRYGAEFFSGIVRQPRRWQRRIALISAMQDALGSQRDVAETAEFLAATLGEDASHHAAATGFILGWHAREWSEREPELALAWKKLRHQLQ